MLTSRILLIFALAIANTHVSEATPCDELPDVVHGASALFEENIAIITCDPGYILESSVNDYIFCDFDADKWDPAPVCHRTCGAPPKIPYAHIDYQTFIGDESIPGSIVRYFCDRGYNPYLYRSEVVCDHDGTWPEILPSCLETVEPVALCDTEPTVPNADVVARTYQPGGEMRQGDSVTYKCQNGYALTDDSPTIVRCVATQWTSLPRCIASLASLCGSEPIIENAEVVTRSFMNGEPVKSGDSVTYQCKPGYFIKTQDETQRFLTRATMLCQDPLWAPEQSLVRSLGSKNEVRCVPETCECEATIPNAIITNRVFSTDAEPVVGDFITYQCETGYEFEVGSRDKLECTANGWSATPRCIAMYCPAIPFLENGDIESQSFSTDSNAMRGDSVIFRCADGYEFPLGVNNRIECDGSSWSEIPTCQSMGCDQDPRIDNARIVSRSYMEGTEANRGDTITYQCQRNFVFAPGSPRTIECTGRTWSRKPVCVSRTCPEEPEVANAEIVSRTFEARLARTGDTILYECKDGYEIDPASTARINCIDSRWTPPPRCLALPLCMGEPIVANARISYRSFAAGVQPRNGDFVNFECLENFELAQGSSVRVSCMNSQWDRTLPVCNAMTCGTEMRVENSRIVSRSFPEGSVASNGDFISYQCLNGFRLESVNRLTCIGSEWSQRPECIRLPCPTEPTVPNAIVVRRSFPTNRRAVDGEFITYVCGENYRFTANSPVRLTCEGTAWSDLPTCTIKKCGTLPVVSNAAVVFQTFDDITGPSNGDSAMYQCLEGFEAGAQDSMTVTCNGDSWSAPPQCTGQRESRGAGECGPDPEIANGEIVSRTHTAGLVAGEGDYIVYKCFDGFEFSAGSSEKISCLDSIWTALPTCTSVIKKCGPDPVIFNGIVAFQSHKAGELAEDGDFIVYKCLDEFEFADGAQDKITCSDRAWTMPPTCITVKRCVADPVVANGVVLSRSHATGSLAKEGDAITYQCNIGYELPLGASGQIVCVNSIWTTPPTCEAKSCGADPVVANAAVVSRTHDVGTMAKEGDFIVYQCASGYEMATGVSDKITCSNSIWTKPPVCIARRCGPDPTVANGAIISRSHTAGLLATEGDFVIYKCDDGFEFAPLSTEKIMCFNSLWTEPPTCIAKTCGPEPAVSNSVVISRSSTVGTLATDGDFLVFQCKDGYEISTGSSAKVVCFNSTWTVPPVCVVMTCDHLPLVPNAIFTRRSYSGDVATKGDSAVFECADGFEPQTGQTIVVECDGENWLPSTTCVATTCPPEPNVLFAKVVRRSYETGTSAKQGDVVLYSCDVGYRFEDGSPRDIHCKSKSWTELPTCIAMTCGSLPDVEEANIISRSFPVGDAAKRGDSVIYQCKEGFEPDSFQTLRVQCDGENWSPLPRCVVIPVPLCGLAPDVANAKIVWQSFKNGEPGKENDSVIFECLDGFDMEAGALNKVICSNSVWSASPMCKPSTCGPAPLIQNTQIIEQSFLLGMLSSDGDSVKYRCREGYELAAGSIAQIECSNKVWSRAPVCSRIGCTGEPNVAYGLISTRTYEVGEQAIEGDSVTINCILGYTLAPGSEDKLYCRNRTWSGEPACIRIETCGAPPQVEGGLIIAKDFEASNSKIGSVVHIRCFEHLVLSSGADAHMICGSQGTWSTPPTCTSIVGVMSTKRCPPRPAVTNSAVVYSNILPADVTNPPSGSFVVYECLEGTRFAKASCDERTNNYVQCGLDGTWTQTPECVVVAVSIRPRSLRNSRTLGCGLTPLVEYGRVKERSYFGARAMRGDKVWYECLPGHEFDSDNTSIECLGNDQWSSLPVCSPAIAIMALPMCPPMPPVQHSRIVYTKSDKRVYVFGCEDGFSLLGPEVVTCSSSGVWSPRPRCILDAGRCDGRPSVENARVTFQSFQRLNTAKSGDYIRVRCKAGYVMEGASDQIICTATGRWSATPACVQRVGCGAVPTVNNAKVVYTNVKGGDSFNGSMAWYECDSADYTMLGSSAIRCLPNGHWTPQPSCQHSQNVRCGPIPQLFNGVQVAANLTNNEAVVGSRVRFNCVAPRIPTCYDGIECLPNGQWSTMPILCV